jgi:hypothetical protein
MTFELTVTDVGGLQEHRLLPGQCILGVNTPPVANPVRT